jgi:hypothetical protein
MWSAAEENKLAMGIRLFGNRWDKVAHMVSRSAASCEAKHLSDTQKNTGTPRSRSFIPI